MAWTDRVRRGRAVLRAWGLPAALVAAGSLAVVAAVAGDVYVELPVIRNKLTVLHVLPVLTATVVSFPLVDRMPDVTLLAGRSVPAMSAARVLAVTGAAGPVVGALVAGGWTVGGAVATWGFVGLAALAVAAVRLWYWAPLLALMMAWLQLRPPYLAEAAGLPWLAGSLAVLLAGGAGYAGIESWRVRRAVRALDTMRP